MPFKFFVLEEVFAKYHPAELETVGAEYDVPADEVPVKAVNLGVAGSAGMFISADFVADGTTLAGSAYTFAKASVRFVETDAALGSAAFGKG